MPQVDSPPRSFPTKFWHTTEDGRVQCDLCPRFCRLREGQRGFCFVRACDDGQIVLTTYGRSNGFCIDPIEKKPLYHFLPGTPVLSFGTAGCNLGCTFCQNWEMSRSREHDRLAEIASPEMIAGAAVALGCRSIAFTYNDPVVFHEYAIDVADACHDRAIKTVAVTAGVICPDPRREFFHRIDAANVDLKAFTDRFYREFCGSRLEQVLETLVFLATETNVWLEITTLLIPGANDSDAELDAMTGWVVKNLGSHVPMHFSAFHPDFRLRNCPPTPLATLRRARELAMRNGVQYAYVGNVHDADSDSTYCHACGDLLIHRDWYVLDDWNLLPDGRCPNCDEPCIGIFEPIPGNWGSCRRPVSISDHW